MADDTVEVELNLDTDDEEQEIARRGAVFRQPLASFLHLFFRLVALVMYLLCDWDGKNFESCFFTIIGLLSLDFWYVKNVSGRLLVGLHWWNQIDEDGNSFWVFEAKKRSPNTGTQTEARIFWLGLIICPLIWTIFFFTALFSLKIEWLWSTSIVICAVKLENRTVGLHVKAPIHNISSFNVRTSFLDSCENLLLHLDQQVAICRIQSCHDFRIFVVL